MNIWTEVWNINKMSLTWTLKLKNAINVFIKYGIFYKCLSAYSSD